MLIYEGQGQKSYHVNRPFPSYPLFLNEANLKPLIEKYDQYGFGGHIGQVWSCQSSKASQTANMMRSNEPFMRRSVLFF